MQETQLEQPYQIEQRPQEYPTQSHAHQMIDGLSHRMKIDIQRRAVPGQRKTHAKIGQPRQQREDRTLGPKPVGDGEQHVGHEHGSQPRPPPRQIMNEKLAQPGLLFDFPVGGHRPCPISHSFRMARTSLSKAFILSQVPMSQRRRAHEEVVNPIAGSACIDGPHLRRPWQSHPEWRLSTVAGLKYFPETTKSRHANTSSTTS